MILSGARSAMPMDKTAKIVLNIDIDNSTFDTLISKSLSNKDVFCFKLSMYKSATSIDIARKPLE